MISIVLATFNGEKFIKSQLDSILKQTVTPDEVIILDDNSQDNTIKILREYKEKYSKIKIVENSENIGHYQNFLNGIKVSQGDYIFFADQDDIWKSNKIEEMLNVLKANGNLSCLRSGSDFIDKNDKILFKKKRSGKLERLTLKKAFNNWGSGYEMLITKELKELIIKLKKSEIEKFDFHDVLIGMLSGIIGDFFYLDKTLNLHRIHETNVTQKISNTSFSGSKKDKIYLLEKHRKRYGGLLEILQTHESEILRKKSIQEYECSKRTVKKFIKFTEDRIDFINRKSLFRLGILTFKLSFYGEIKNYISDFIYAFELNTFVMKIKERK